MSIIVKFHVKARGTDVRYTYFVVTMYVRSIRTNRSLTFQGYCMNKTVDSRSNIVKK